MRNETRQAFNTYLDRQAELNHVASARDKFSVEPSVQQKLEDRIREASGFLQDINIVTVPEQKGQKIGLDVGTPIASTTNTSVEGRTPKDPSALDETGYEATQTNFDTFLTYRKLDMWAKFPDFQTRIRNLIVKQQARDRIMIGFNGTSRAATSDLATNPKLQDVNVGWLEKIRVDAPERAVTGWKVGDQAGADYKNIDAAVMDAANELIDEWFQEDTDLVCIMGRQLLSDKYLGLVDDYNAPTERAALETLLSNKQVGGLRTARVPFFLPRGFLITKFSNLSIYAQEGTRRRHIKDDPEFDRIVDYQSDNEAYVIENYGACAFVENILVPDGGGGWA
ncbi:MAG: phage major capsid protein, P2 family [Rhodobiaceae bacterium]|nr:phage major capsid protein, P2 family [Rhodobiaceae bacterium]